MKMQIIMLLTALFIFGYGFSCGMTWERGTAAKREAQFARDLYNIRKAAQK